MKQTICKYAHLIRLYEQPAQEATGPVHARHIGDRMYDGEYFVLQTDAHMTFIDKWDEDIIRQFDATHNEYAVLSTYPTEVEGALDKQGHSNYRSTPVMCITQFTPQGLLRHGSAQEVYPMFGPSPILHAFWAAGFSFSRGHFTVRVPYDCCMPMMFQGEEIVIAVRAWTHGYDMYTPHNSVAFHFYHRKQRPPMFWENNQKHQGEAKRSANRAINLIDFASDKASAPDQFDHTDMEPYGLGTKRKASEFYKVFGIDRSSKKIVKDLCKWSASGAMHKELTKFISPDHKGIDYSKAIDQLNL